MLGYRDVELTQITSSYEERLARLMEHTAFGEMLTEKFSSSSSLLSPSSSSLLEYDNVNIDELTASPEEMKGFLIIYCERLQLLKRENDRLVELNSGLEKLMTEKELDIKRLQVNIAERDAHVKYTEEERNLLKDIVDGLR